MAHDRSLQLEHQIVNEDVACSICKGLKTFPRFKDKRSRSKTANSADASDWQKLILHGVESTDNEIGRGAYGRVFEVDYEGIVCAAKEVHAILLEYAKNDRESLKRIKDNFVNECQIWSTLDHPCIVQFLGVYYPAKDNKLPVIVMERMQRSLRDLVEKHTSIALNAKLSILNDIAFGLQYLHSRDPPILHRDLTPNNVLLCHHLKAKITDLGVAKSLQTTNTQTLTQTPGTSDFMPPECLYDKPVYGLPLDIFSFGGVILYMGSHLWPRPTSWMNFDPATGKKIVFTELQRRQECFDKMTGDATNLKPLVVSCLDDHPKSRPSVTELVLEIKQISLTYNQKVQQHIPQHQEEQQRSESQEQSKAIEQQSLQSNKSQQSEYLKPTECSQQIQQEQQCSQPNKQQQPDYLQAPEQHEQQQQPNTKQQTISEEQPLQKQQEVKPQQERKMLEKIALPVNPRHSSLAKKENTEVASEHVQQRQHELELKEQLQSREQQMKCEEELDKQHQEVRSQQKLQKEPPQVKPKTQDVVIQRMIVEEQRQLKPQGQQEDQQEQLQPLEKAEQNSQAEIKEVQKKVFSTKPPVVSDGTSLNQKIDSDTSATTTNKQNELMLQQMLQKPLNTQQPTYESGEPIVKLNQQDEQHTKPKEEEQHGMVKNQQQFQISLQRVPNQQEEPPQKQLQPNENRVPEHETQQLGLAMQPEQYKSKQQNQHLQQLGADMQIQHEKQEEGKELQQELGNEVQPQQEGQQQTKHVGQSELQPQSKRQHPVSVMDEAQQLGGQQDKHLQQLPNNGRQQAMQQSDEVKIQESQKRKEDQQKDLQQPSQKQRSASIGGKSLLRNLFSKSSKQRALSEAAIDTFHVASSVGKDGNSAHNKAAPSQRGNIDQLFVGKYDYSPRTDTDLGFKKGDLLKVVDNSDEDWWFVVAEHSGQEGYIPSSFVAKVGSLEAEDWYFGDISRKHAEFLLMQPWNAHGSFLVRNSASSDSWYTLSLRDKENVRHGKLWKLKDVCVFLDRNQPFNSLHELVLYYSTPKEGLTFTLKSPCFYSDLRTAGLSKQANKDWEIDRKFITTVEKIRVSQYCEVWQGKWNNITSVAVKVYKPGAVSTNKVLGEVALLKKFQHSNLIQIYAVCTKEEPIYIISELMKPGSLLEYLRADGRSLKLDQLIDMGTQIATGMAYLESKNYIHGNVAARNVLITELLICKVDFCIIPFEKCAETLIKWIAPEAARHNRFTIKSDVWSYGILLYELITRGHRPYPGITNARVLEDLQYGYRMPSPKGCPEHLYKIMCECWNEDPDSRPTFETIQWKMELHY